MSTSAWISSPARRAASSGGHIGGHTRRHDHGRSTGDSRQIVAAEIYRRTGARSVRAQASNARPVPLSDA